MRDYDFEYEPPLRAGRVVFRARNAGSVPHDLNIQPLEEDFPPIEVQLRGSERRAAAPFARVLEREPGHSGVVAVDLVPGRRYALICFVVNSDGTTHGARGMATEFRAAPASEPSGPPAPSKR